MPQNAAIFSLDFNPLHREGGDAILCCREAARRDFNPLHREGGDGMEYVIKH